MVFYQLSSIVNLNINEFPTSNNCVHLNLQLSSANYKQLTVQRPYALCKTVKYQCRYILIYLYCNYLHYSYSNSNISHYSNIFEQFLYLRIVFVFIFVSNCKTNTIWYSYSFQNHYSSQHCECTVPYIGVCQM